MKKNKGFTLIELLVVIAIIGILASVVLASLSSARSKGVDVNIKANLTNARPQAELFYAANSNKYVVTAGSTDDICSSTALAGTVKGINGLVTAAATSWGGAAVGTTLATAGAWNTATCHSSANAWAAEAPLKASANGTPSMYCVDSTGVAKVEAAVLAASATVCA